MFVFIYSFFNLIGTFSVPPATLLIIDARSYTAALGNRAKGGGVELPGMVVDASQL